MNLAAASSRSAVVTPGRHFERSIRRQRAWIAPAAAILEICSGVLMTMPRYTRFLGLLLHLEGSQQRPDPFGYLFGGLPAVDPAQNALALVVGDHRLGLRVVLPQPDLDDFRLVVVADDQPAAAHVAHPLLLRRVEVDVEDVPLLLARAPPRQPAHDLLVGDLDQDRRGEPP